MEIVECISSSKVKLKFSKENVEEDLLKYDKKCVVELFENPRNENSHNQNLIQKGFLYVLIDFKNQPLSEDDYKHIENDCFHISFIYGFDPDSKEQALVNLEEKYEKLVVIYEKGLETIQKLRTNTLSMLDKEINEKMIKKFEDSSIFTIEDKNRIDDFDEIKYITILAEQWWNSLNDLERKTILEKYPTQTRTELYQFYKIKTHDKK